MDPVELAEARMQVAEAAGLPPGMSKRLQGSTRAELEADADALAPSFQQDQDDQSDRPWWKQLESQDDRKQRLLNRVIGGKADR